MEFCDDLAEVALGWLGWSEEQTLYSDINAILIAERGLLRKLKAEAGKGIESDKKPKLTPASFDAMFGVNAPKKGGVHRPPRRVQSRPPIRRGK